METKKCCMCNNAKSIEDFYFRKDRMQYHCRCKECEKLYQKQYKLLHKKDLQIKNKEYYEKNKTSKIEYQKNYYQKHRIEKRMYDIEYKNKNKEKRNKNEQNLYSNNILYKLKKKTRNCINKSFKRKGYNKNTNTYKIIGCDYNTFIEHLLNTFKNNYGYEWNKQECVHIDHIIPLSTAKSEDDVIKLCYYTNLQLLKAKDNLMKSNKLNWNGD